MESTRLSPIEKIGYGLGDFGSNVVFQTIIILLPSFYTDVFGLAPAAMATMFLVGAVMDFEDGALRSGFTFNNPNEKSRCGCGESFSV